MIRIVVDKPEYLLKPTDLLHDKRSGNTGKLNADECDIGDDQIIPAVLNTNKCWQMQI